MSTICSGQGEQLLSGAHWRSWYQFISETVPGIISNLKVAGLESHAASCTLKSPWQKFWLQDQMVFYFFRHVWEPFLLTLLALFSLFIIRVDISELFFYLNKFNDSRTFFFCCMRVWEEKGHLLFSVRSPHSLPSIDCCSKLFDFWKFSSGVSPIRYIFSKLCPLII